MWTRIASKWCTVSQVSVLCMLSCRYISWIGSLNEYYDASSPSYCSWMRGRTWFLLWWKMKGHAIPAAPAGAAQLHGAAISLQLLVYIICTHHSNHALRARSVLLCTYDISIGRTCYSYLITRHTPTQPLPSLDEQKKTVHIQNVRKWKFWSLVKSCDESYGLGMPSNERSGKEKEKIQELYCTIVYFVSIFL